MSRWHSSRCFAPQYLIPANFDQEESADNFVQLGLPQRMSPIYSINAVFFEGINGERGGASIIILSSLVIPVPVFVSHAGGVPVEYDQ